ncbi:unnamed protein product [Ambrosiozyma monospora]|uniref:Unnamed protein product n=1 Tax=Ambrosiozyma monospora TaxID=43982 RepID=A0A9W6Z1U3_AMBMO|nr:unnamed protein product [Ambrosiozyma monospora]
MHRIESLSLNPQEQQQLLMIGKYLPTLHNIKDFSDYWDILKKNLLLHDHVSAVSRVINKEERGSIFGGGSSTDYEMKILYRLLQATLGSEFYPLLEKNRNKPVSILLELREEWEDFSGREL